MKLKLKKVADQVIVITGASSGIGLATARLAAQLGARLVLAARSESALKQLAEELTHRGCEAITVRADVSSAEDVASIAGKAIERFSGFDTWVNNAGVGMYGKITDSHIEDMRKLFETNFWGVVYGSLEAVRHFKQHSHSYGKALINIGSTESDRAAPLQGIYAATKHALKGFTDGLRMDIEQEGAPIAVTLIKPGAIDTPFPHNAKNYLAREPQHVAPVYAPDTVAQAILHCAATPVRDLYVGAGGKANAAMGHYAPRWADKFGETILAPNTHSDQPPRHGDALDQPSENLREHGDYSGHVAKTSLYTQTTLHPLLTGAAVLGAAWAMSTLWSGGSRRAARTHYDGNHLGTAASPSSRSQSGRQLEQASSPASHSAAIDKNHIREHMNVRGADGYPVGKVDKVEGRWIKLTKDSDAEPGQHHYIDLREVRTVEGDVVCLNQTADEAKRSWHGEPLA